MSQIRITDRLTQPGDFMATPQRLSTSPGERIIAGYLLCPRGCKDALAVGEDQWNGQVPTQCPTCKKRFYIKRKSEIIELTTG
jgi:hypothetical protein